MDRIIEGNNKMVEETGEFDKMEAMTKEAVIKMLGFEVRHVGINCADEKEADETASAFESMFGMKKTEGPISFFAGIGVEVMKSPMRGTHGHIAIATDYIDRACYYLEKEGIIFEEESAVRDEKGKLKLIYLKGEFGGFAVHLVQK